MARRKFEYPSKVNPKDYPSFPASREEAKEKGVRFYFSGEPCGHGHTALRNIKTNYCIVCSRNQASATYHRYKPLIEERRKKRFASKEGKIWTMWTNARNRALKNNIPFTITEEDIHIPDICPITGIPFSFSNKKTADTSPTLDKIDNEKGCTPDNIIVVSHKANRFKNNLTFAEMELMFKNYKKVFDSGKKF